MQAVTVGMIKVVPVKWDPETNLATLGRLVPEMAEAGAHVVITPEAFLDGYVIHENDWTTERFAGVCERGPEGPGARRIREIAAASGVYLVAGLSEKREDGFYNTSYLIGPDGRLIGQYHKLQVNPRYEYGKRLPVFETSFGTVGMMICADRRWPEICRTLKLRGAEVLLMPTYGMKGTPNDLWLRTRSYENALWICFTHPEESLITDPRGNIVARLVGDEEYLIHTLDPDIKGDEKMIEDRHPDVYGFAWEVDGRIENPE